MAKIGNEAKLILKLAEQQMKEQVREVKRTYGQVELQGQGSAYKEYIRGYEKAVENYETVFNIVIRDLEAK